MGSPFTPLGPVVFANFSTAERLLLDQRPGLTVRDTDLGVLMMSDGLTWSEYITKTRAICMVCGNPANRSQRLSGGKKVVEVGAADKYEARCRRCFKRG